jgi:putative protein-disulfide isomerase
MSKIVSAATGSQFTVFSNPYCLWCYAFGPAVAQFRQRVNDSEWTLVIGDLFNAENAPPVTSSFISYLQQHARRATDYSKVPFAAQFWTMLAQQSHFDSTNASAAMRAFAKAHPTLSVAAFDNLQQRFFGHGEDISQWSVLQTWARENGAAPEVWQQWPHNPRAAALQKIDAQAVKRWSVNAYPALLVSQSDNYSKWLARGFSVIDVMWQNYQHWLPAKSTAPHCTDAGCHG